MEDLAQLNVVPEWDNNISLALTNFNGYWIGNLTGEVIAPSQEQIEFLQSLPADIVEVGGEYQHYKHNPEAGKWHIYETVALALLVQDGNNIACVIYRSTAEDATTNWARALRQVDADLISSADEEPTPWNGTGEVDGVTVPKFTRVQN